MRVCPKCGYEWPLYEKCKECKRRYDVLYNKNNKERDNINMRNWRLNNPIRAWFTTCKSDAKFRGIPFYITWEQCEFIWSGRCAETNVEFTFNNSANSPTFDRFDPDGVYEINNVRIVTNRVNAARGRNPLPLYREFM